MLSTYVSCVSVVEWDAPHLDLTSGELLRASEGEVALPSLVRIREERDAWPWSVCARDNF